jgi:hypothetical protein
LLNQEYIENIHNLNKLKSSLKQEIHDIKFSTQNPSVKPSGKLKYMSAYRFFRREMVPIVKSKYPDFDGKTR